MNIQQEGMGCCTKCGTPIMQAIGQPGIKGVCLGCQADALPKTGRTVVVTSESGEGTALGKVTLQEVEHQTGSASALPKDPAAVRKAIMDKANAKGIAPSIPLEYDKDIVKIEITLTELEGDFSLVTILDKIYDAIDNLPPGKTLKETKRLIALQDKVSKLRFKKESK